MLVEYQEITFHFIDFFVGFGRGGFFWSKRKARFAAIPAT